MSFVTPEEVIDRLRALFEKAHSQDYIGEPVSQSDHALQAAALASRAGGSRELVIAALLHDVGHLDLGKGGSESQMNGFGTIDHEKIAAQFVRELGFPDVIAELILGHVEAKRYLVFKHPHYLERLSPASLETLKLQGGPMDQNEAAEFEKSRLMQDKLKLRAWDDQAKLVDHRVPDFESYREMLLAALRSTRERR